jgi:hypothetical protein
MPRIRELSFDEMPSELGPTLKAVFGGEQGKGTTTGTPGTWWTVWAREIALVRTGYVRQSRFVFS